MKGFTLLEALISVLIFSFLIVGIYATLTVGEKTFNEGNVLLMLQQNTRRAMDTMVKELREALNPTLAGSIVITPTGNQITFSTIGRAGISYYVLNNQLVREFPAGTIRVVGNNVANLLFIQNSHILTIGLTESLVYRGGRTLQFPLREEINLRNP
ncbi:MAG: prepilin-type N-terminal cleavage/methylation domain-containing protein [Candidatus Omnitrophica bacterium]|nr:prepilin-type N-terminal cleavage/methylation domain-containing protein [Candidatus Omnitrophota bacterium]